MSETANIDKIDNVKNGLYDIVKDIPGTKIIYAENEPWDDKRNININCEDLKEDCFAGNENLLDRMKNINEKRSSAKIIVDKGNPIKDCKGIVKHERNSEY